MTKKEEEKENKIKYEKKIEGLKRVKDNWFGRVF